MTCFKDDDLSETIRAILEKKPNLRSDTPKLVATLWYHEAKGLFPNGVPAEVMTFLKHMGNGRLTNPATISRRKRLIQAEFPELAYAPDDRPGFVKQEVKKHRERLVEGNLHRTGTD